MKIFHQIFLSLTLAMLLMVCSVSSKIYIIILWFSFGAIFPVYLCVYECMMMGEFFHFSPFYFCYFPLQFSYTPVLECSLCALLFCVCICVCFLFLLCIFYYLFYDCLKWPILSRLTTQIAHFLLLLLSIISV